MEDSGSEAPPCWHPLPFWLPPRVLRSSLFSPKSCNSLLWSLILHTLCRFGLTDTPRRSHWPIAIQRSWDRASIMHKFFSTMHQLIVTGPDLLLCHPHTVAIGCTRCRSLRADYASMMRPYCDWFATRHTPLRRAHLQLWRIGRLHGYPWSLVQSALVALPAIYIYIYIYISVWHGTYSGWYIGCNLCVSHV